MNNAECNHPTFIRPCAACREERAAFKARLEAFCAKASADDAAARKVGKVGVKSHYIGYMSGDKHELHPDLFESDNMTAGKPWGSYVWVAGPYASKREALNSLIQPAMWAQKEGYSPTSFPNAITIDGVRYHL